GENDSRHRERVPEGDCQAARRASLAGRAGSRSGTARDRTVRSAYPGHRTGCRDQHWVCPAGRSGVLPQGVRPLFQGHSGRHPARRFPLPHRRQGDPVGTPGAARRGQDRTDSCWPRSGYGQKGNGQHATARGRARLVKIARPNNPTGVSAPRYVRRSLSNGIDLWISTWKMLPLVQVSLTVPIGTGDDSEGKAGLAHLTARLLDQGTSSRTATELAEAFEQLGTTVRVGAGHDDTVVGGRVLARNLEPTLTLLAEMLASPRFDLKDFDRERSQQLASLLQGPEDVDWLARRALPIVMYNPEHPYGKPAEGYPETVKRLTLGEVRAFHSRGFGPKGATLIVTGDVDPDAVTRTLEQTLGRWRGGNSGPGPRPVAEVKPEPGVIYLVDKPGAVQSVISVG